MFLEVNFDIRFINSKCSVQTYSGGNIEINVKLLA